MYRPFIFSLACACVATLAFAQDLPNREGRDRADYPQVIPAAVHIRIRTDQPIDVRDRSHGRIYTGSVAEDVFATDGNLAITCDARAELIVQNLGDRDMTVDLESVTVQGRRYMVAANTYDAARQTGVGANR